MNKPVIKGLPGRPWAPRNNSLNKKEWEYYRYLLGKASGTPLPVFILWLLEQDGDELAQDIGLKLFKENEEYFNNPYNCPNN